MALSMYYISASTEIHYTTPLAYYTVFPLHNTCYYTVPLFHVAHNNNKQQAMARLLFVLASSMFQCFWLYSTRTFLLHWHMPSQIQSFSAECTNGI